MMRSASTFVGLMLVCCLVVPESCAAASETEDQLVAIQKELPFMCTWYFLLNHQPMDYDHSPQIKAAWDALQKLSSVSMDGAELVRMSGHKSADIRALALLALAARETPDFVPVCIRLVDDFSPTMPADAEVDFYTRKILTVPQTVASVARRCLRLVGCDFKCAPNAKADFEPDAETWWKLRQANTDWLGWHDFLYQRARGGILPVQPKAKPAVKAFRSQVDLLPPKTRAWLLLFFSDDVFMSAGQWQDWYATEQEMISAVQMLGAPALLEFLRSGSRQGLKEPALDDPRRGKRFVTTYAKHFFTAANADDLISLKLYTAAIDADPSRARQIKDEAMQHFSQHSNSWERAEVMAAMTDHGDDTDRAAAVKWFYTEGNGNGGSTPQSVFIKRVKQRRPRAGIDLVKLLVSDPAFDRLRPMDVIYLALLLENLADHFSYDHSWREEKVDDLRAVLKAYFKLGSEPISKLQPPEKYLDKPEWTAELDGPGNSLALQPGGSLLAVGMKAKDGGVSVLDAANGKEKQRIEEHGWYLDVFFTHDGSKLLFHSSKNIHEIRVWDAASGQLSWQAVDPQSKFQPAAGAPYGFFYGDSNHERFFWVDLTSYQTVWSLDHERNRRWRTTVSPDAKWIALVDEEFKTIRLLDSGKKAALVTEFTGHASHPEKFAFSPDSSRLISAAEDERVILWDVAGRRMQSMFRGELSRFGPLGFTADSQAFFVSLGMECLGVFSLNGTPLFGIKRPGDRVAKAVPSRDGRFLFILVNQSGSPMSGQAEKSRIECWRLK